MSDVKRLIRKLVKEALDKSSRLDDFTKMYIDVALATSIVPEHPSWHPQHNEEKATRMSQVCTIDDFDPATLQQMIKDCKDFQIKYREWYEAAGWEPSLAGYDFWMSRNYEDSGFITRTNLFNTVLANEKGPQAIKHVRYLLARAADSYGPFELRYENGVIYGD